SAKTGPGEFGAGQALIRYAQNWDANIAGKRHWACQSATNSNRQGARHISQHGPMNGATKPLM
ncbi:MAG: hypothetical protein ACKPAC_22740, partial [Alphaproteobacteria bacterium]